MKKQSVKGGNILIKFNKRLYNLKAIKLAIKEYQNLANFNLGEKRNYIEVRVKDIDKDVEKIIRDEFSNYVLSLMKS